MSRVEGADEFIRDLRKLGDNMKKVERAMIKAGGEVMAESWRNTIKAFDFIDHGDMLENVKSRVSSTYGSPRADITSEGYDRIGTRNAFKAFILHYGTKNGRIPASHWIDVAEDAASAGVHAAMSAVLTQALNGALDMQSLPSSDEYTPFVYDAKYWQSVSMRRQNRRSRY